MNNLVVFRAAQKVSFSFNSLRSFGKQSLFFNDTQIDSLSFLKIFGVFFSNLSPRDHITSQTKSFKEVGYAAHI